MKVIFRLPDEISSRSVRLYNWLDGFAEWSIKHGLPIAYNITAEGENLSYA